MNSNKGKRSFIRTLIFCLVSLVLLTGIFFGIESVLALVNQSHWSQDFWREPRIFAKASSSPWRLKMDFSDLGPVKNPPERPPVYWQMVRRVNVSLDHQVKEMSFDREQNLIGQNFIAMTPQNFRLTPSAPGQRTKSAVFLGCSFLFGTGVQDAETIPFYFEQEQKSLRSYNFGIPGGGPHDQLQKIRAGERAPAVIEKDGYLIYVYIRDQVARLIGTSRYLAKYGREHPYFYVNSAGQIVQEGDFAQGKSWASFFSPLFMTELMTFFHVDWPRVTPEHRRFFAQMINELRREYARVLPKHKFIFVFYPERHNSGLLTPFLEEFGIPYLDYTQLDLGLYDEDQKLVLDDFHPTPLANQVFARQLAHDLELNFKVLTP